MSRSGSSLNWYDLNYWDDFAEFDSLEIIKNQEERCSFLKGSDRCLKKNCLSKNPKYILTNGDPRLFDFKV